MRFKLETQVVEFLFDTCARFNDLLIVRDDEVLASSARFFVAAIVHAFAAGGNEVRMCHVGT
jgi:hypothetical protein